MKEVDYLILNDRILMNMHCGFVADAPFQLPVPTTEHTFQLTPMPEEVSVTGIVRGINPSLT